MNEKFVSDADKLDEPPFLEQMNPYESIFSP